MSYSKDDIQVLGALDAVRARPGMYVGSTGPEGVTHLVEECVNNALDEHLAGHAHRLEVRRQIDGSVSVHDDGRGIPVETVRLVCEQLHAGATADGHTPHVHLSPMGLGLAVVNALSAWLRVQTVRGGRRWMASYVGGVCHGEVVDLGPARGVRGTHVHFLPDPTVFSGGPIDLGRCERVAPLVPGLHISIDGRDVSAPSGLSGMVDTPEVFERPRCRMVRGSGRGARVFVNFTEISEGDVFEAAREVEGEVVLDVRMDQPQWGSRTRTHFIDPDLAAWVREVVR